MELHEIFLILLIHYIADFLTQTDYQANGKSKELKPLLQHVDSYCSVWVFVSILYLIFSDYDNFILTLALCATSIAITFVSHAATDYITSRISSKYYQEKKYRKFFNIIGFDQLLHYFQLFLTYKYIICS